MFSLRAMDTEITLHAPGLPAEHRAALGLAVGDVFAAAEARFSRFLHHSELSQLNRATEAFAASPALLAALLRARGHVAMTEGRFDPTIGGALIAAGYDQSFDRVFARAGERASPSHPRPAGHAARRPRFEEIDVDEARGLVYRPLDIQLDLGGMIKGATVDEASRLLPRDAALDAGGDAVLRGDDPADGDGDGSGGWLVEVEDPRDPDGTVATLRLRDQAVATSAANRRRWRAGQRWAHHLIDPATGAPARTDLLQVTVVADRAERAEVLAKAAFIAGSRDGARLLSRLPGVGAVLVRADGALLFLGALDVVEHAAAARPLAAPSAIAPQGGP